MLACSFICGSGHLEGRASEGTSCSRLLPRLASWPRFLSGRAWKQTEIDLEIDRTDTRPTLKLNFGNNCENRAGKREDRSVLSFFFASRSSQTSSVSLGGKKERDVRALSRRLASLITGIHCTCGAVCAEICIFPLSLSLSLSL